MPREVRGELTRPSARSHSGHSGLNDGGPGRGVTPPHGSLRLEGKSPPPFESGEFSNA
jgi:hypothetical protein